MQLPVIFKLAVLSFLKMEIVFSYFECIFLLVYLNMNDVKKYRVHFLLDEPSSRFHMHKEEIRSAVTTSIFRF